MLGFTYTVNFWDFFNEGLNCRAMTEQKSSKGPSHWCHMYFQAVTHNTAKWFVTSRF
jgi:hypothetical protein